MRTKGGNLWETSYQKLKCGSLTNRFGQYLFKSSAMSFKEMEEKKRLFCQHRFYEKSEECRFEILTSRQDYQKNCLSKTYPTVRL